MPDLTEQYRQLCKDSRHYDLKLFLFPSIAYVISVLFYSLIFDYGRDLPARLLLAALNGVIFSGFLFQFVKDRAFQLEIQSAIRKIQENSPDMVQVSQYSGSLAGEPQDRWFIKLLRKYSAANYVFYVLLLTLLIHVVAIFLVLQQLNSVPG